MSRGTAGILVALVIVILAAGGGYWLGGHRAGIHEHASTPTTRVEGDSMTPSAAAERKILYYRNPMGLPDVSPVPKKDSMGMDYIPVYADDSGGGTPASASEVRISLGKIQQLGVRTEAVARRILDQTVSASGRIEPDERRIHTIAPKFEGYVEQLQVNVTGQPVTRGQALFTAYSPELVSAQREYAIAAQGLDALKDADEQARAGMRQLAESSLLRLRNWDISEDQIKALTRSGTTQRLLTFHSPASGIVTEKKAVAGMRFMPGETLYQITDLSSVWVMADVFEQDIGRIRNGTPARLKINAYPEKTFSGTVTYVYPTLNAATRTVPVRVELANPGMLLKPAMYAQVEFSPAGRGRVLTVSDSAVIDSGTRQVVLVQLGEGRFEPRDVRVGARGDTHVEIISGVKEGEHVVVAANFLIDSESNLRAALSAFAQPEQGIPSPGAKQAVHRAEATVDSLDAKAGTAMLSHGPVASLKWPAMTMEFSLANAALARDLQQGARVTIEFVERKPGDWMITAAKPLAPAKKPAATTAPASPHAGH